MGYFVEHLVGASEVRLLETVRTMLWSISLAARVEVLKEGSGVSSRSCTLALCSTSVMVTTGGTTLAVEDGLMLMKGVAYAVVGCSTSWWMKSTASF